jgi:cytochrome c oxidase subunit 4
MSHENGEHAYRHMVQGPQPHAHHVGLYWTVFGMLVVLTLLTVYLAEFDFGTMSVMVTLLIAGTKASLVLAVFMHLYFDNKFFALIVGVSLVFISLFILFPIIDMGSRDLVDPIRGDFVLRNEKVFDYESKNPGALPMRPVRTNGSQDLEAPKKEDLVFEGPHH